MDAEPASPAIPPDEVVAHAGFVRRLAGAILRNDADADDAAQETLAKAIERGPKAPEARRSWLATVVRNCAASFRRQAGRREERERRAARPEAAGSTAELVAKADMLRRVALAVDALEPDERAVVILRHYDGLPPRDIAARLGLPVTTIKSRLQRAHAHLRSRLDDGNGDRRRTLMAFAGFPSLAPVVGSGVAAAAAEGVLMATSGKAVAAAAAAVLLLGAGAWIAIDDPFRDRSLTDAAAPTDAAATPVEGAGGAPVLEGSASRKPGAPSAPPAAVPPPVDLATCDRDLDLFGVVVDKAGKPIAGADLVVVTYPARRATLLDYDSYDKAVEGARTKSSVDGTFSIRLRRGEHVALQASAGGFAAYELARCTAGQRLRVVLGLPVTLTVALKDEAGAPVADVPVRLFRSGWQGQVAFTRRAVSDALGLAVFTELPGGVTAYVDPKPLRLGQPMWKDVTLPEEGEAKLEIVLVAGRKVTGRVTDAVSGAPIAGARVGINWTLDRAVTTGPDGRYELVGWNDKQGATDLHATAEGYGRAGFVVGTKDVVDFALSPGDAVVGRAVDRAGRVLPGVLVSVVAIGDKAGGNDGDIHGSMTTRADGRFRITSLKRDQDHAVVLMADGFGRYLLDFEPRPGSPGEIDLGDVTLPPARAIEGRVLDGDGAVVPGVDVVLKGANGDRRRAIGEKAESGAAWYGQTEETRTDDLGRFRFPDLSPGDYRLKARREGQPPVERQVALAEGKDAVDADIVLDAGREVVVALSNVEGEPLPGAYVAARGTRGGEEASGRSDAKGEVRLRLGLGGTWRLDVNWFADMDPKERRYLAVAGREIGPKETRIALVLEEAGTIVGRVEDGSGAPILGATLEAYRGAARVATTWATDGTFTFDLPRGAPVTIVVASRYDGKTGQSEAWRGEAKDVAVGSKGVVVVGRKLPADRTLSVLVLSPEGKALPNLQVFLTNVHSLYRHGATDASGVVTFNDLTAERVSVLALPDGSSQHDWLPGRLDVTESDGQRVEVRFRVGAPVSGVVLDADGNPAPAAVVETPGGPTTGTAADAQGRFRLLADPEARLPIKLRVSNAARTATVDYELTSVPAEGLTIRLGAPRPR